MAVRYYNSSSDGQSQSVRPFALGPNQSTVFQATPPSQQPQTPYSEPPGVRQGVQSLKNSSRFRSLFGGSQAAPAPTSAAFRDKALAGWNSPGGGPQSGGGLGGKFGGPALFAYLIAKGKTLEQKNPNSVLGRGLLSGLGPSFNQVKKDPKLAVIPHFLHGWLRNKKAAKAKPEWAGLFNLFGG